MTMIEPIRYHDGRPMLLAGVRRTHRFDDIAAGIAAQWPQLIAQLPLPGQRGATTYGAICGADAQGMEYLCAVEVDNFDALPKGVGRMRIEPQRYAVFLHRGHVSTLHESWSAIFETWLPQSNFRSAHKPDFEVYDERFDPKTGTGDIEIWVAVLPKV